MSAEISCEIRGRSCVFFLLSRSADSITWNVKRVEMVFSGGNPVFFAFGIARARPPCVCSVFPYRSFCLRRFLVEPGALKLFGVFCRGADAPSRRFVLLRKKSFSGNPSEIPRASRFRGGEEGRSAESASSFMGARGSNRYPFLFRSPRRYFFFWLEFIFFFRLLVCRKKCMCVTIVEKGEIGEIHIRIYLE